MARNSASLAEKSGPPRINCPAPARHKSAWAKAMATAWLLERDYEVFRRGEVSGLVDLIALKPPELLLIVVRLAGISVSAGGNKQEIANARATAAAVGAPALQVGAHVLYVGPDGNCSFDPRQLEAGYIG